MADINLQRKSSTSALWWVLGIIALVIIIWMVWAWTGTGRTGTGTVQLPAQGDMPQAVIAVEAAPVA